MRKVKRYVSIKISKYWLHMLGAASLFNVYWFFLRSSDDVAFASSYEGLERIDWHDHEFMAYEASRIGPGENGSAIVLTDPFEIEENEKGYREEGIYTVVNNMISHNRSLPDTRLPVCKTRKYLRKLPTTSIIVIFYNENWNLLMRCLHSIYNRTPPQVLKEMILVSDASTDERLDGPLREYVEKNFGKKAIFFKNEKRLGLIVTRMEGARKATGEVIVFLDSHMEVNVNWLPPLLDPIAVNYTTAAVPMIDSMSPYTLEYQNLGHGARGSFDWTLTYQWLLLTEEYQKTPGDNYQLSVMTGGAFAINRKWFFHLGGYDEGLMIWNGENWELSFKLHLCGGNLIQVPCSHVAHTTKHRTEYREQKYGVDYSSRNLKRVAEVWMDEYKQALYNRNPDTYKDLDPGDLTAAFALKKRLKCKPFKYFVTVIADDLAERFPPFELPKFASGAIYPEANQTVCITYAGGKTWEPLRLLPCVGDRVHPNKSQHFDFAWHRFVQFPDFKDQMCLDSAQVSLHGCHYDFGNQLWRYDLLTHQMINVPKNICISVDKTFENLFMADCNATDLHQKFNWGYVNIKALANWETEGRKIRQSRNP